MFDPQKDDYPSNAAGKPEFASIILDVDAHMVDPSSSDVTQKIVLSTQTVLEALSKLSSYYGEPHLLSMPLNAALVQESGRQDNPVFVYTTPQEGRILVLTSTPTWEMLVQNPDFGGTSSLLAIDKLTEIVATLQGKMQQLSGGFSNLLLLDLSPEKFSGEGQPQDAEPSGDDEGNAAESLVGSATVERV